MSCSFILNKYPHAPWGYFSPPTMYSRTRPMMLKRSWQPILPTLPVREYRHQREPRNPCAERHPQPDARALSLDGLVPVQRLLPSAEYSRVLLPSRSPRVLDLVISRRHQISFCFRFLDAALVKKPVYGQHTAQNVLTLANQSDSRPARPSAPSRTL